MRMEGGGGGKNAPSPLSLLSARFTKFPRCLSLTALIFFSKEVPSPLDGEKKDSRYTHTLTTSVMLREQNKLGDGLGKET